MSLELWEKRTAIVQNVLVSLGLLASGAWVLFTFVELRAIQRSRAEIAEVENRAVPAIDAKLDIELLPASNGRTGVALVATVENRTNRPITLNLQGAPFALARVSLGKDGRFIVHELIRPPLQFIHPPTGKLLSAAPVVPLTPGTSYFDVYTEVVPGTYYATFVATFEDRFQREIEQSLGLTPPKSEGAGVGVNKAFVVPPPSSLSTP